MRIKIIKGYSADSSAYLDSVFDMLSSQLNAHVTLTDTNPDVVHVVGGWNSATRAEANTALARFIPVVHTPLASLSPWLRPSVSDIKLSGQCLALVASGSMEYSLLDGASHNHTILIPCAVSSALTTPQQMVSSYITTYDKVISENDTALWASATEKADLLKVDSDTIRELCRRVLYAHSMYVRQNIPLSMLRSLAQLMTESEYDEDFFCELLRLIHLDFFMARLQTVMHSHELLQEGYMPLRMVDDKQTAAIAALVTDYE